MTHIKLENLSFQYNAQSKPVFSNAHFSFDENKITFLQGKNGCGKSTLFKILTGKNDPKTSVQGTFYAHGKQYDITSNEYAAFAQKNISKVDQKFDEILVPHLTFQENIACARFAFFPSFLSKTMIPDVPDVATKLSLPLSTPVQFLSGGQRQILAILMILQRPTSILLLDEPTATLDHENSILVMKFLCSLINERPLTIIIISHDSSLHSFTNTTPMEITTSP